MKKEYRNKIRSKQLIRNAVIELLDKKGNLSSITVSDVVEKANINRGTFYNHYNNVMEVIEESKNESMKMILDERGKKYLLKEDCEFQSDLGIVTKEQIANCEIGDELKSHLDHTFKIVKPTVNDFIDLMDRRCSILVKKDIGTVLAYTGLGSGDRVVDSGTGAGAIALNFGNVVGDTGKVYTYEIREDFAKVAQKNIETFGINNIEVKNKDIKEGIDEQNIDLVFLDLPKPFEIFEDVYESLKVGGWLAVYAPYIDQAEIAYRVAKKLNFYNIEILETLERGLEVRPQGVRPKTRMVGHTGYLVFARKL